MLTFIEPVFDVCLSGVDGLVGLAAHVVDVGAELRGPAEVDRYAHRQLLESPPLLCQTDGVRIFLRRRTQTYTQKLATSAGMLE